MLERKVNFAREDALKLLSSRPCKAELWDWQYHQNPAAIGAELYSVALYSDDQLLGFCGVMPCQIRHDGETKIAAWCCDLFVDAERRGAGIGGQLYQVIEAETEVGLGFGTSDTAYRLKTGRGWQANSEVREFFFHRKANTIKELAKLGLQLAKRITQLSVIAKPQDELTLTVEEQLDQDECTRLWSEVETGYQRAVVRDGKYMHWKYNCHPSNDYRFLCARDRSQQLRAALVVRKQPDKARIVDYLGPANSESLKHLLLGEFIRWSKGCRLLQIITTCPEWIKLLNKRGFLKYSKNPRFTVITKQSRAAEVASGWFLMTGDSDSDMIDAMVDHQARNARSE